MQGSGAQGMLRSRGFRQRLSRVESHGQRRPPTTPASAQKALVRMRWPAPGSPRGEDPGQFRHDTRGMGLHQRPGTGTILGRGAPVCSRTPIRPDLIESSQPRQRGLVYIQVSVPGGRQIRGTPFRGKSGSADGCTPPAKQSTGRADIKMQGGGPSTLGPAKGGHAMAGPGSTPAWYSFSFWRMRAGGRAGAASDSHCPWVCTPPFHERHGTCSDQPRSVWTPLGRCFFFKNAAWAPLY